VIPARSRTSSTARVCENRLRVSFSVSTTERSLSSPPVCMTAEIRPEEMACSGVLPNTVIGARAGFAEPEHHVDGGGLAGAIGAEEGDHLPGVDGQGDAVHGADRAKVLVHVVQRDGRRGCLCHESKHAGLPAAATGAGVTIAR